MLGKIGLVGVVGTAGLVAVTTNSFVLPSAAIVLAIVVAVLVYMFMSVINRIAQENSELRLSFEKRCSEQDDRIIRHETKSSLRMDEIDKRIDKQNNILVFNQLTDGD